MDQHPPARAIPAPATCGGPTDPVDRCRSALDALASRGSQIPDLPADWPARVGAMLAAMPTPSATITLPFPPTSERSLASEAPAGVVIEGFLPPDAAITAWRATSLGLDAFRTPVLIVQADPIEFLAGCARCDDSAIFTDLRCHWFIGPSAAEALRAFLHARLDTALPKHMLRAPGLGSPISPTPESILSGAHDAQLAEHTALRAALGMARRSESWAERFAGAFDAGAAPLRILIPTTRYSTYVRHAALDLAAAFTAMGHSAITLEEPTTDARLASVAYLRAARDLRPDLIVSINYTRAQLRGAMPDDVPMVCWVQDRMPHLFDRALGVAQGPLDFLAGHIHPSLYLDFGYPRARALFRAVPASPRTFHDGRSDSSRDLACDVMYAGHQSESPDALRDRLLPAFASVPGLIDAARDIDAHLRALATSGTLTAATLDTCTRDALAARNIPLANARAVETFDATYTRTLAERIHRHQTLEWAADICARRSWKLHLYGNGWDHHPTLAPFARPALEHADALRDAYRSAGAAIHTSLASNAHQRIAECALSGGLMLRRGPCPDWQLIKKLSIRAALRAWGPGQSYADRSTTCFKWSRDLPVDWDAPDWDHPHMHRLRAVKGKPPLPPNADGTATTEIFCTVHDIERDLPRLPDIPLWTFPDYALPRAEETAFASAEELEAVLDRAITDPQWRATTIADHRRIAADWWTTDRFAADLLDFIADRLKAAEAPRAAEAVA